MENFEKALQNPPKKYRPIPFWSWNEKLTTDETAWQIGQMDEAGIGGYFMHARGGLQTEYMGREWMDNVRCGIEEGRTRDMGAWGYDENGWPSGFGGGIVNGLGVKYQQKYLRYELLDQEKQDEFTITNLPFDGRVIHLYYDVNPFYVDTLDKEVIAKFLEVIHDRYVKELGDDFKDMAGFFTDEPQISRNGIPWSLILPAAYRAATGEELLPQLPALFFEVEGYEAVRYQFWKVVRDLFTDAFMKQIYDWCNAHGTELTGHMVLEETMESQIVSNAACMPNYEYMHIPGMDWLGRAIGPSTTAVQVSSVAHQLGKKQVLSETFALCGWDVSFEELKWLYEWQMVRGINLLCQHLEGYSLRGIRKRDYPATLFYQQPWWGEYRALNDTLSRIGMLLSEGEVHFGTLVIHPMSSAWCCFNNSDNGRLRELDSRFMALLHGIETAQIHYDLGDERILERHAGVGNGALTVGRQTYRVVIVPDMINISSETAALLEDFAKSGGVLLFSSMIPAMVDGVKTDRMEKLAADCKVCADLQALIAAVPAAVRPVQITAEGDLTGVASTVRTFPAENKTLIYIVNTSKEPRSFTASFDGRAAKQLDYFTGELVPVSYRVENGKLAVDVALAGMGSILLFAVEEGEAAPAKAALSPIKPGNVWQIAEADLNALTLDTCDCYFDGELFRKSCPVNNIQEEACAFKRPVKVEMIFPFEVKEIPDGPLYLVMETPEKFTASINGKAAALNDCGYYRDKSFRKIPVTDFVQMGHNEIKLTIDFKQSEKIYRAIQNSLIFESEKNMLSYDTEIEAIYLIGDFGVDTPGCFTDLEKRAIRYDGSFAITKRSDTVNTGCLVQQGFPFFNGRMVLKSTVTLGADELAGRSLRFADRCTTVVKVRANGKDAGTILWQPYEVSLDGLLQEGENEIEIELIGNLRNLLGPHHLAEGESYFVGPHSFFENSPIWTGGKNPGWDDRYHFVQVGLFLD